MKKELQVLFIITLLLVTITGCGSKKALQPTAELDTLKSVVKENETGSNAPDEEFSSDTIKWINAVYALLTEVNGGNWTLVGGYEKTEENKTRIKEVLQSSWEVTDRSSADKKLEWLLAEGHRTAFADDMKLMEEDGLLKLSKEELESVLGSAEFSENQAACYTVMLNTYKEKGAQAIDALDDCLAMQLLGWCYLADYYTEQETLERSLQIAKELQTRYASWEELMESYLTGYHYMMQDNRIDMNSATYARYSAYEQLRSEENNPYTLKWDTVLGKIW